MNPFLDCPVYETEHFIIRKLKREDAEALFSCYSDPDAARFFNGDCCEDDFYYTDLEKFKGCVEFWLERYEVIIIGSDILQMFCMKMLCRI